MTILCYISIILYMIVFCRMSGGGLNSWILMKKGEFQDDNLLMPGKMPFNLSWVPELLFALPFGIVIATLAAKGFLWTSLLIVLATIWSYLWMETGHGVVLHFGDNPEESKGSRKHTLSPFVDALAKKMNIEIGSKLYCYMFFALKGFLISLPIGGIFLAITWPIGYYTSRLLIKCGVKYDTHAIGECICGFFAGLAIVLFMILFL